MPHHDHDSSLRHRLGRTIRTPIGVTALTACLLVALVAVLGPVLLGDRAAQVDTDAINQGSSAAHLLGTDQLGRDIAARVVVATRLTLRLTLMAAVIGVGGGLLLGVAPAVVGRRLGRLITATVGVLVAFPGLLFLLFLATIFGVGSTGAVFAVGLAMVPPMARLVQNLTASIAGSDYVAAARILGVGRFRMVVRHLLPNIAEPSVLFATQATGGILVAFSGLSFLGLGVQPPQYDWGRLLNEQLNRIFVNPAAALAPGAAVVLTGLMFGLVGEVLAQAGGRRAPQAPETTPQEELGTPPEPAVEHDGGALVRARDLRVTFPGGRQAVRGISLDIGAGEAVGLVGESGSGKSLSALALADLVPHPGRVSAAALGFDGHDLRADPRLGTELAMVFQDPMASLNPALRVGRQLAEVAEVHLGASRAEATARAVDRLDAVRIATPGRRARQRPHEYSGGMRQRAVIAMGLMGKPKLIIADEPTTALDVAVQREVLDLLAEVREESGAALLLISHDLAVVAQVCERVLVMYAGLVVENLPVTELLGGAAHPYTRALVGAVPTMTTDRGTELATIPGRPPEPGETGAGCPFAARCERVRERCHEDTPELTALGPGRQVACWYPVGTAAGRPVAATAHTAKATS
ncbi:dipeptide/oligopeptide/nickel ABC transporter permease/ATP-binding protein [Streptomyces sp. NBC_00264]|uniref:dipeptide/oligopeptide/nickel ABC transporter permease/ATP-binding protein n=1 Tax=unclassified Streptomyces TaxID=2593676 RepID=UPI000F5BF0B0|nr:MULTISPECIES: dipeptide/oligopeptide/nickel ABC transporter permease/ATP-binding protein [unclassified Streptomyces]WSX05785.1 dipeptide/oligopeptide/nickel ABC transporter permease/ATP-binding protein [Streptomyces sp. NBC_00987]MCX4391960.1 dipeptide/oligopeptide/nickel ABC transporter permease/ATP-binding protein [Streptomyces sp. NBC_01767]MCX5164866.1 dipeptide/oligopeptide/nickel ABC transporter permease/ATP-binding protein [Streptomyces sp. NBC_00305]MCX5223390.1 dipeptide/oligopeptid